MALPTNPKTKIIPPAMKAVYEDYLAHSSWYSGDIKRLHTTYAGKLNMHWSKNPFEARRSSIHVPIAGDIATTSADLLFSDEPNFSIPESLDEKNTDAIATQDRLNDIIYNTDFLGGLIGAAETSTALGGVYLKVDWDKGLSPYPLLSVAQADTAIPEFKYGILQAVTFWRKVGEDTEKKVVYYFLERHERINGIGHILYGLYKGTTDELGIRVPFSDLPEFAHIVEDTVNTQIEDLLVRYVPNKTPNRKFRGSQLGQSDYAGIEILMDALDEVYSSWMRDIRLGQGRIMVPETYLEPNADGTLKFDMDSEAYTTYNGDGSGEDKITINQFEIRTEEHMKTAMSLLERIVTSAGYSLQTFGLSMNGSTPESGKALNIRERKSGITTNKKKRYWIKAIEDIMYLMLQVDKIHLGTSITPYRPTVQLSTDGAKDIAVVAQAVQLLDSANALSIKTRVRMVFPEWDDEQVDTEVAEILKEKGLTVPGETPPLV